MRGPKLPEGLYWRNNLLWGDVTDPRGKRHRFSTETDSMSLAKAILEKERERILSDCFGLEQEKITSIRELLHRYLEESRLNKTLDTWTMDRRRLEMFFHRLPVERVEEIQRHHFVEFFNERLETGRNGRGEQIRRSTAAHDVRTIRTFLNWAVEIGALEKNPCPKPKVFKADMGRKRIPFLSPKESVRLYHALLGKVPYRAGKGEELDPEKGRERKTPLAVIFAFAVYAGLRANEILYLNWENISFERNEIEIVEKEGWKPKTREERVVPLFPVLRSILEPLRVASGPIFHTASGKRLNERNVLRDVQAVAKRHGIEVENGRLVNFVVTRHTFASQLVSAGISIFAVSQWLGHTSVTTTQRHYAEFAPAERVVSEAGAVFPALR